MFRGIPRRTTNETRHIKGRRDDPCAIPNAPEPLKNRINTGLFPETVVNPVAKGVKMTDQRWIDDPVYVDYDITKIEDDGWGKVYHITDHIGTLQTGWNRTDVVPQVGDVMRVFNRCWGMAVRGKVLFRKDDKWSAVVDWYIGQEDPDVANGDPRAGEEARQWWRERRAELMAS